MNRIAFSTFLLCFCSGTMVAQQPPAVYKGQVEKLPAAVAPQPITFSHKQHVAVGQTCLDCHPDATEQDEAGLPKTELCMACHETIKADSREIKKLASAHKQGRKIRWTRVYRLPDFVFFSHAHHAKAGLLCQECHGPVAKRNVLAKEVSTSMVACMNCHAAKKAATGCSACHQLSQ